MDKNAERSPKNSPAGETEWYGAQPTDQEAPQEALYCEATQHCANCEFLKSEHVEYGRLLFERDLAQRNLRIANFRLGDKLQKERNKENNASKLQEPSASKVENKETRTLLNGYANHLSDSEGSSSEDEDRHGDHDDSDENDNDDNDDNNEIRCVDDEGLDNGDDNLNDDDDDDDYEDSDDDNDHDDDDNDDGDNDDGNYNNTTIYSDDYRSEDASCSHEDEEVSLLPSSSSSSNINISCGNAYSRNADRSLSENNGNGELLAAGGRRFYTNEINPPIASVAGIVISQGARPKNLSQKPVSSNADSPGYNNGKIPSLEVTGINQGFLARHSTDQSLPCSSYTNDRDMSARESTSLGNWSQTSFASNDESSTPLWGLPRPPASERSVLMQERAYSGGVNQWYEDPVHVGYQPTAPTTSFSGWQLPHQHQPQLSATGNQGSNSFNRRAWMSSGYDATWPRYDYGSNEPALNSPAVNPPAPAITLPSVALPNASAGFPTTAGRDSWNLPPYPSNTMSGSVTSRSPPLNTYNSNQQERLVDFTTNRPFGSADQQENRRLLSSETVSSRRQEEGLSRSNGLSQEVSQFPAPSEDNSLVALERKVAEACAVVERVLKEREERTKRQREAAQRQREIREQRQRDARERREREERERRERAEREAREREDVAAEERAPVQESPLWQCEHYQRRCSVKFPCCGVFYPCHRCHNGSGACDADDKKANQATHVKCASCGHEEEINERSQNCSSCGAKMSEYFCFKCKHFTGVDKNPFHCNKCGICRIYKDRSFHCDVCNVCLDKRLEGKHKCRPDSGHDECCICLEDAFSGCQILPCSHKVHRECAIAMIQNGVRNCPICRHPLYSQGSQQINPFD
ncbi:hypothetical protein ACROYT_G023452 [Oculina patagonica]